MTTEISVTDEDIRMTLQQKVNQVTNLELQNAALQRTVRELSAEVATLKEGSDAESGE